MGGLSVDVRFISGGAKDWLLDLHYPDGRISLIDESYNTNPLSMRAAIEVSVARFGRGSPHRRVLILGDMLELGKEEAEYHRALARLLSAHPPDALVLCGPLMATLRRRWPLAPPVSSKSLIQSPRPAPGRWQTFRTATSCW